MTCVRPILRMNSVQALVALLALLVVGTASEVAAEPVPLRLQVVEGVEFVTEGERPRGELEPLAAQFLAVQQQMSDDLDLPIPTATVRIYLFRDRRRFAGYVQEQIPSVRFADAAVRHGIFLLRQGHPYIFLLESDDLVSSLRHEAAHVVLNLNSPDTPIWIDEGLAQCYASPAGDYDSPRSRKLLKWNWLRVGELGTDELPEMTHMQQLSPRAYACCWEHVYGLLTDEQHGRPLLRSYLAALREGGEPPVVPLSAHHEQSACGVQPFVK